MPSGPSAARNAPSRVDSPLRETAALLPQLTHNDRRAGPERTRLEGDPSRAARPGAWSSRCRWDRRWPDGRPSAPRDRRGPSCQSPRRTTAPDRRATTSPLRRAIVRSRWRSQASQGFSTGVEPRQRLLGDADLRGLLLGAVEPEVPLRLVPVLRVTPLLGDPAHRPLPLGALPRAQAGPARPRSPGTPPRHGAEPSPWPRESPRSPRRSVVTRCDDSSMSTTEVTIRSRKARSWLTTTRPPRRLERKSSRRSSPSKSRSFVGSSSRRRSWRESRRAASDERARCPPESDAVGSSSRRDGSPRSSSTPADRASKSGAPSAM